MGALIDAIQQAIELEDVPLSVRSLISDAADEMDRRAELIRKLVEPWELEPSGWLTLTVLSPQGAELVGRVLLTPEDRETLKAVLNKP